MSLPKITIIIPTYNVAPYLVSCLDSVLAQTHKNLEILLIDDGSTDTSPEICKSYTAKDPRIIYHRQKNTGVSSARNTGLRLATGRYISFIDPDDTVDRELISYLFENLVNNHADLSTTTFKKSAHLTATLGTEEALRELFLEQNLTFHLWAKLYKRELWDGISFPVGHNFEDVATLAHVVSRCQKVHIAHAKYYHYRRRPGAILSAPSVAQFADLFRFAEQNLKLMQQDYPRVAPYAEKYLFTAYRRSIQDLLRTEKLSPATRHTYLAGLKKYAHAALSLPETPKKEKLIALLSTLGASLPLPILARQAHRPQSSHYD